jgi:hypothetical protein
MESTDARIGRALLFLAASLILAACGKEGPKDLTEYYRWVNDPEHGLIRHHEVNGITLTMKYMPPSYLAHQYVAATPGITQAQKDSVMQSYRNSLCFLLTIGVGDSTGDIMTRGIGSYEEFSQRAMRLNFEMQNYVTLRAGEKDYRPALAIMENTYGMTPKRDVVLVFADDASLRAADTLDVRFNDTIFETGISHYEFLRKDMAEVQDLPL